MNKKTYLENYKKVRSCVLCKWNKHTEILQFHHRNPNEKEINIHKCTSIDKIKEELKKCDLLCPNCHFWIHYNNIKEIMQTKVNDGKIVARAPFGYKVENKQLIQTNDFHIVKEIFETFINQNISLTKLGKKYGFSTNGLIKILRNKTYLGELKFDGKVYEGKHKQIIETKIFYEVQDKLKKMQNDAIELRKKNMIEKQRKLSLKFE